MGGEAIFIETIGGSTIESCHHHIAEPRRPTHKVAADPLDLCPDTGDDAVIGTARHAAGKDEEFRPLGNAQRQVHRTDHDFRKLAVVDEHARARQQLFGFESERSGQ